jgi:hypothetical protein
MRLLMQDITEDNINEAVTEWVTKHYGLKVMSLSKKVVWNKEGTQQIWSLEAEIEAPPKDGPFR